VRRSAIALSTNARAFFPRGRCDSVARARI
jgi:hypothetical protein